MTTFQDPPLQSRRAARQGERPESSATPFTPPQVPRTAAGAGEPLSYVTQNRPPLPGYDGSPSARGRRSSEPVADAQPAAPSAFRPRDFSPEARSAPPAWAPEYERDSAAADNGVVDYHTQARASVFPGASVAASLASEPPGVEETLSRRELRAIRDAHGITAVPTEANPVIPQQQAQQAAPQQYAAQPQVAPQQYAAPPQAAPAPAPSTQLDSAMAEFDSLAGRGGVDTRPPATQPRRGGRRASEEPAPEDGIGAFDALFGQPEAPAQAPQPQQAQPQPQQAQPQQGAQFDYSQPPAAQMPPAQQVHAQQRPAQQPPVQQFGEPQQTPQYAEPQQYAQPQPVPQAPQQVAPVSTPTTGERPIGHWTNQSDIDDRVQVSDSTISRTIGSGALTTSALVLPSLPGHNMATGQVMLTDSISLPSGFAATGAHTPLDESDIDHLLDPGDHQLVNTDSVPIRAIRAVSSHSSSRNIINAQKPARGNRMLTMLIASASVMVVVVVTLLIVALVTDVL
jgi:hypothetical protein